MKFSAQEEYGLRCLVTIAIAGQGASLTIPEVSRREGLSLPHVAKLLAVLRRAGLVVSTRGQAGGYVLGRSAESITIREVLDTLGGRMVDTGFCDRHSGTGRVCVHDSECFIRPLWSRIQSAVDSVSERVTIADLIAGHATDHRIALSPSVRSRHMETVHNG